MLMESPNRTGVWSRNTDSVRQRPNIVTSGGTTEASTGKQKMTSSLISSRNRHHPFRVPNQSHRLAVTMLPNRHRSKFSASRIRRGVFSSSTHRQINHERKNIRGQKKPRAVTQISQTKEHNSVARAMIDSSRREVYSLAEPILV